VREEDSAKPAVIADRGKRRTLRRSGARGGSMGPKGPKGPQPPSEILVLPVPN